MTYDPATLPATYTHQSLDTLEATGSPAVTHHTLHEIDREQIRGVRTEFGLTPAASVSMGYVRSGDDDGLGIWLPMSALQPGLTINPNFDHFQRSTSAVTSTTTFNTVTSFAADRMFVLPAGASVTQQRSTTVPNTLSRYSLAITGASSVTTVDVGQRIRAAYQTRYRTSLLFQAWVRNESGAAYTPTLRVGTPSATDNFGTVNNRLAVSLQQCADAAWTRVYHVFDPSGYTDIANGLEVVLRIPSGSSVASDVNRIAQFDLRPGVQLMDFLPPDPDAELLRCLPYCRKWGPGATNTSFANGVSSANNAAFYFFPIGVPMIKTPTLSLSAVGDFSGYDGAGSPATLDGLTIGAASPDTLQLSATQAGTSWTAGNSNQLLGSTSATLALVAELT